MNLKTYKHDWGAGTDVHVDVKKYKVKLGYI